MKAKKFTLLLAALIGASALAACTDDDKKVDFNNYWQYSSLAGGEKVNETLVYGVTFTEGAGLKSLGYTLSYGEGSYTSVLKNGDDPTQYTYTTKLTVPVTYTLGDATECFEDTITTSVSFMDAGNGLRPLSSTKTVVSHSPASSAGNELEACYAAYNYTVVTTYTEAGKASSTITSGSENGESITTPDFKYGKGDYSYLDNEQILLALRAVSTSTTSGKVETYNPFLQAKQRVSFTFESKTSGEFAHTVNGNALASKNIAYRAVNLVLDAKNPGATQTAWIAATADDPDKNTHRNALLYLETPVSYSIGTFKYTLKSAQNA